MSLIAVFCALVSPVYAQVSTPDWLLARSNAGSTLSAALEWEHPTMRVQVADPIVFPNGLNTDWVALPARTSRFQMIIGGPPYHEPVAALLTFSDTTPACSTSAGLLGVDAGMGAFLTPQAQDSISTYLKTLPDGWTLYDGLIYDQNNGDRDALTLFQMPDDVTFAGFSTGGDGGFGVDRLIDAEGSMVALMVSLRGAEGLLPQGCTQ